MKIHFFGATQTVTGSRFLVEEDGIKALVDCGLFQGPRQWKEQNWREFPVNPRSIDCIILTHAHIDHSGFLPRLMKLGFRGPVYCTPATAELLGLMLPDSGHLQEEDAFYANKKRFTKHDPALPLYTEQDAREVLSFLRPVDFYSKQPLTPDFSFTYRRAGHILGSAMIEIVTKKETVLFTGDLGRPVQYITKKPDEIHNADCIVLESTYGNRLHQRIDVRETLKEIIRRTAASGGTLLVPAFAIGRTQELLFLLRQLQERNEIPELPVYIDSPMAIHSLPIYNRYPIDASIELEALTRRDSTPFLYPPIQALETVEQSMTLNKINYPSVIVSSSGMATGGRILHHLKRRIDDHRNTVLFIGFQAEGTKGRFLVDGAQEIKIHGQFYKVRAQIEYMDALSCHADYEELLQWLGQFRNVPRSIFLVHGEQSASAGLADRIRERFGWNVHVPAFLDHVEVP